MSIFLRKFRIQTEVQKIRNISNVNFDGSRCLYPRDLGMGSKVQNSTFSEHGHVAYQIKENHECSNMVPNILLADTLTLGMGQKGQNLPFSELGNIEYQFKGNQKMQQQGSKYLPGDAYPLAPTLGMGSEGQKSTFSEHGHVAYQNERESRMQQRGSKYFAHRPPPPPTTRPCGWDQ